jgi:hypothetical protein
MKLRAGAHWLLNDLGLACYGGVEIRQGLEQRGLAGIRDGFKVVLI